jgi:hypothetical protein
MSENSDAAEGKAPATLFFDQPHVEQAIIPVGQGIPIGLERVSSRELGIGGAYGTWGHGYDNLALRSFIEHRLGETMRDDEVLNLAELGFIGRHHLPDLSDATILVSSQSRSAAARSRQQAEPSDGVLIDDGPAAADYVAQIARAGIPDGPRSASTAATIDGRLHLALNPI